MKNTLMFLLVSLLLAFSLTACGGGQTTGAADNYGTNGQTGGAAGNGMDGSAGGTEDYRGDSDGYDGGLANDARDAVDDAGRSVRNAVDDAGRTVRNAVDDAGNAMDRAF